MKILHYSLGLYPHRAGGLNKYCTDLMREQSKNHEVSLLYPNGFRWWKKQCFVSKPTIRDGITCYRLINALPVSLLYGIKNPKDFYGRRISENSFEKFFETFQPDVLHLHTIMGLPEDALAYFKRKGVRIVYTSHDYFGICPKVNMINEKGEPCEGPDVERCRICNTNAPSTFILRIRNSNMALMLRDTVRWIKNTMHF